MPQLLASAAGPSLAAPLLRQGSGPTGQPRAAAPVTVAGARQAMLSRLQQMLGNPPSRPGGGAGSARNPARAPLPAALLDQALAYPSLVSAAAQRAQAQQQHQQRGQQSRSQEQPLLRVMPAPIPAQSAVSQPRSSGQPAGGRGGQQPQGGSLGHAAHETAYVATPAAVRSAPAASGSVGQSPQDAASAEHPALATDGITPPPDRSSAQPIHPLAAAAWRAPSQLVPAPRAPNDAYESGEQTEDEAWMPPPAKRQRRRTAAAAAGVALRQQFANKASECARSPTPYPPPNPNTSPYPNPTLPRPVHSELSVGGQDVCLRITSPISASHMPPHAAGKHTRRRSDLIEQAVYEAWE